MRSKLVKKIIGGFSLTTALFVFQACYGPPRDFGADVLIEGVVKSQTTGLSVYQGDKARLDIFLRDK